MKASEYLLAKAIENNDFELTKLAANIKGTSEDIEFLTKEAGLLDSALKVGGNLLRNNVVKNTLISSGVGAAAGTATAEKGQKMSGAIKGGLIGATLGGGGTFAKNINSQIKAMKAAGKEISLSKAITDQATNVGKSVKSAFNLKDVAKPAAAQASSAAKPAAVGATAPKPNTPVAPIKKPNFGPAPELDLSPVQDSQVGGLGKKVLKILKPKSQAEQFNSLMPSIPTV